MAKKVYVSLTEATEELKAGILKAMPKYDIAVNTSNRTTPVSGGQSKMEEANEWGADLYIAIRTGNVSGIKIIAAGTAGKSWNISNLAMDELKKLKPYAVEGVEGNGEKTIDEIAKTNMTSLYILTGRADSDAAMAWVSNNIDNIGTAICNAVDEFFSDSPAAQPVDEPVDEPVEDASTMPIQTGDAALGAAVRTLFKAFWEENNGR